MYVSVISVANLLATQASIAAINGDSALLYRLQAVQSLRQCGSECFKLCELVACEQITVRQPPPLE